MPENFKILQEAFYDNRSEDEKNGYRNFETFSHLVSESRVDQAPETILGQSPPAPIKEMAGTQKEVSAPAFQPAPLASSPEAGRTIRDARSVPDSTLLTASGEAELWRKKPLRDLFARLRVSAGQKETAQSRLQGVFRR